ncbi:Uncharacterised protein [Salmonella enterica subsp. enterica]|nr:Uncharacterised protein [Salmonella enterica subsp. enterica]
MMMMHGKIKNAPNPAPLPSRGRPPRREYLFKMRTIINNYHLMIIYFILRY